MNALALLKAVRCEIPDARPALTLSLELRLVVSLCERPGECTEPRFYDATLDEEDMKRDPEDIAHDVARLWREHKAARA